MAKKFSQQIAAFVSLGYEVFYTAIDDNCVGLFKDGKCLESKYPRSQNKLNIGYSILLYNQLYKTLYAALRYAKMGDIVYCRSPFPTSSAIRALKKAKSKGMLVVIEVPTYPAEKEYNTEKRIFRRILLHYVINKMKYLAPYVDKYALIGEHADSFFGRPAVNISNGIDVQSIPIRKRGEINKNEIHLLALATMCNWHGFDRIIKGIFNYAQTMHEIKPIVHFVGADGDGSLKKWMDEVNLHGLCEYFVVHGPLYNKELDAIFDLCIIGFASLGIHRIGLSEASILKTREYMARGLPFVYSTKDAAIPLGYKYAYRVPQDDSPIDIELVVDFALKNVADIQTESVMRSYAQHNMTWESQFLLLIDGKN